jgi:hypothetical protein
VGSVCVGQRVHRGILDKWSEKSPVLRNGVAWTEFNPDECTFASEYNKPELESADRVPGIRHRCHRVRQWIGSHPAVRSSLDRICCGYIWSSRDITGDSSSPASENSITVEIIRQNIKFSLDDDQERWSPVSLRYRIESGYRFFLFDKTERSIKQRIDRVSIRRIMIRDCLRSLLVHSNFWSTELW